MPNQRSRNSRDDKSGPNKRTTRATGGRKPASSEKPAFGEKKNFGDDKKSFGPKKREFGANREEKPKDFTPKTGRSDFKKEGYSSIRTTSSRTPREGGDGERRPYNSSPRPFKRDGEGSASRSFGNNRSASGERKPYGDRPTRRTDGEATRSYTKRPSSGERTPYGDRALRRTDGEGNSPRPYKPRPTGERSSFGERPYTKTLAPRKVREDALGGKGRKRPLPGKDDGLIRLNRYISNAGICSRRKADELIAAGVVSVNGEVVSELGYRVNPSKDVIRYNGETLKREKMVYVLLNKPKDYITTTDDPQERRTVMQLVEKASKERIYPVGRLDRNTTGLLLMTNDGDLADKLSHPKTGITKIYQVELNKSLPQGDLNKIAFGLELEDGLIKPDAVSYVQGGTKREIGIQIHSGRNRIVRRIFEHLGYDVVKLDRVIYANLTKKDLTRGRWRYLDEKEIIQLKHLIK
ncbi:MAG: pseudouridine synthase [Sphingobacteriales bacterium]|nr:pseudouridine synthase [Sphingobacteriales bacterium]